MIGSRTNKNITRQKELVTTFMVPRSLDSSFECAGVITGLQIPLMIIDRRGVSIMSALFTNRRVTHLGFVEAFEWIRNIGEKTGQHRDYFDKHRNCFWDIGIAQGGKC